MTKPILAPTDFSEKSAYAVRAAALLAKEQGAPLVCMHVIEELDEGSAWLLLVETPDEIEQQMREARMERLQEFCGRQIEGLFAADAVEYRVEVGSPTDEVLFVADEIDAAMVVVGTLGYNRVLATFLGSTANQLIRQSDRPVLIVPPDKIFEGVSKILAPVDFSEVSRASLDRAVEMARAGGGEVYLLHAMGTPPAGVGDPNFPVYLGPGTVEALVQERQLWLDEIVEALDIGDVVKDTIVRHGEAAVAVDDVAKELEADLICMGSHGRRGLRRFLLGNTAERVLRRAPCAVLVVHEEADAPLLKGAISPDERGEEE